MSAYGWNYLSHIKRTRSIGGTRRTSIGSDPVTIATVASFGEITAASIAGIVSANTGIPTDQDTIIRRAVQAGFFAPGYATDTLFSRTEASIAALAQTYFDGGEPTSAARALIPLIERFGQDKLAEAIQVIQSLNLEDTFVDAGTAMIGRMLSPIVDLVRTMTDAIGGAEAFAAIAREIGAAVGKAASDMGQMMPIIGGFYKLVSMGVDWINSRLFAPSGSDVSIQAFAKDPLALYIYINKKRGVMLPDVGSWTASYNPFYQETFVQNTRLVHRLKGGIFSAVRALDLGNYRIGDVDLPSWRETFTSDVAMAWIRGAYEHQPNVEHHGAAMVKGCGCWTLGNTYESGVYPVRWSQDENLRAAVAASCFINANIGCIRGIGQWNSSWRAYQDAGTREYDLGYGPDGNLTTWWARFRSGRVEVAPPVAAPFWGDYVEAVRRFGVYTYRDPETGDLYTKTPEQSIAEALEMNDKRCLTSERSSDDTAFRTKLARWKDTVAVWIPLSSASSNRLCPRVTSMISTRPLLSMATLDAESGGDGGGGTGLVVAGGLGVAALIAWLALS